MENISAESKMRAADRVLTLEMIDGKKTLSSTGLTDPRLFSGENKLHAIMDPETCLWALKYEMGGVPPVLKCQFTSFKALLKFAEQYYYTRNIRIKEIKD